MRTLRHPTFDDVTVGVPDEAAERWQLAGWLADEPAPLDPSPLQARSQHNPFGPGQVSERDAR